MNFRLSKRASVKPAETRFNSAKQILILLISIHRNNSQPMSSKSGTTIAHGLINFV